MTKVTPSERRRGVAAGTVAAGTVAAGTVGLAAFSAVAGTVVAHAAENPVGLPLSTNAVTAVKGLMEHNHGAIAGLPVKSIPVVGDIPALLGILPADKLPGLDGVDLASPADAVAPAVRARPLAGPAPHAAPSGTPAPMASAASQQAPKGSASPLDGVTGLTEMLPMKLPLGGLEKSLPVGTSLGGAQQGASAQKSGGGLPLVGGLTGGLPGLGGAGGAGDLLGGLPLGGLTSSLSHLGG